MTQPATLEDLLPVLADCDARLGAATRHAMAMLPQPGPCFICKREARAALYYKTLAVCLTCAPHSLGGELMIKTTETETEALEAGGAKAGAFLDSIGKTDLAELSEGEWATFLAEVLDGYSDHMRQEAKAAPPF
jgi:hypothetical protein